MNAAVVAVGSELLGSERLDTNSLRIAAACERHGVDLVGKSVVGDSTATIAEELRRWATAAELVVVTGGLGPTEDDRTRAAAALAFGRELALSEEQLELLRRRFAAFGRPMAEVNRRQAEVLSGAEVLRNDAGTAPGQRLDVDGTAVFLLPGVPRELEPMLARYLEPWLAERADPAAGVERRTVRVANAAESDIEQRLLPAYERFGRDAIGVYASPGDVRVVVAARGEPEARRAEVERLRAAVVELVGSAVYCDGSAGVDDPPDLATAVVRLLAGRGLSLTTAESCTGGLLGAHLTAVPGSSAVYLGGAVTYSNGLKMALLGVPEGMLAEHGAVSEPVAVAMARGVRERWGGDFGVGVTGIAGPGGATPTKPVGTVHVAVAGPIGEPTHRGVHLPGDRESVRVRSVQMALDLVRRKVLAMETAGPA